MFWSGTGPPDARPPEKRKLLYCRSRALQEIERAGLTRGREGAQVGHQRLRHDKKPEACEPVHGHDEDQHDAGCAGRAAALDVAGGKGVELGEHAGEVEQLEEGEQNEEYLFLKKQEAKFKDRDYTKDNQLQNRLKQFTFIAGQAPFEGP